MHKARVAVGAVVLGLAVSLGTTDPVQIWGASTARRFLWLEVAAAAAAVLLLGLPQFTRGSVQGLRSWPRLVAPLAFGSWMVWALVGVVSNPGGRVDGFWLWLGFVLVAVAGASLVQRGGWRSATIMAAAAVAGHSLLAFLAMVTTDFDTDSGRLQLAALEPNQLARPLALVAFLSFVAVWSGSPNRWIARLAWAALTVVALGALVLTESRTASVAFAAAVAIWFLGVGRIRTLVGLALAGSIALGVLFGLGFSGRVADQLSRSESTRAEVRSLTGRTSLWPLVVDQAADDLATGVGIGRDRDAVLLAAETGDLGWRPLHAHNLAVHVLLVTGAVGLALFGLGFGSTFLAGLLGRDAVGAGVVALLAVDGVSEAVFTTPNLSWALLAGAVAAVGLVTLPAEPTAVASDPVPSGWFAVGSASCLGVVAVLAVAAPYGYPYRFRCRDYQPLANGAVLEVSAKGMATGVGTEPIPGADPAAEIVKLAGTAIEVDGVLPAIRCAARENSGLTIESTVQTASVDQAGPARIFTVSNGTEWNDIDLQIGQEGSALTLRVRQGRYRRFDGSLEGVFVDTAVHHLAVSIDRHTAVVFIDGEPRAELDLGDVDFGSWRPDRKVILGNEATGNRPFLGTIGHLRVWPGVLAADIVGDLAEARP